MKDLPSRLEIHSRRAFLRAVRLGRRRLPVVRLGSSYGGWVIPESCLDSSSLVVSVGVGEDTTFDEELLRRYSCRIEGVDPTPRAAAHVARRKQLSDRFSLHRVALAGSDGERTFYPPQVPSHVSYSLVTRNTVGRVLQVRAVRLTTLMTEIFGKVPPNIDLLKLDIEGAEGEVIADLIKNGPRPTIICVEFDRRGVPRLAASLLKLRLAHYRLIAVDGLNVTLLRGADSAPSPHT